MKRIISILLFIAAIIAIPEFYIHIKEYMASNGGSIKMLLMNRQISNNDERTIFVCVSDERQTLNGISITPIYDNSSEYPVNGFDLRYNVEIANGEAPAPNSLFDKVSMGENVYQYKYKENLLPQYSQTYEPFRLSELPLKDSRYIIKSKASYIGTSQPYYYTVRLWIRVIPKRKNQSIEDWKLSCKDDIYKIAAKPDSYDAFLCCDNQVYYEFGKDFGSIASTTHQAEQEREKNIEKNKDSKKVEINENKKSISPTLSLPEGMKYIGFSQFSQDSVALLSIKTNQVTNPDSTYYVVYHIDKKEGFIWKFIGNYSIMAKYLLRLNNNGYFAQSFTGNGTDVVTIKPFEEGKIDYITTLKLDKEISENVILEKKEGRYYIMNKSDKNVVVEYGTDNSYTSVCALCIDGEYFIPQTADNVIKIVNTLTFEEKKEEPRPWWDYLLCYSVLLMSIGSTIIYAMLLIFDEDERNLENILWGVYCLIFTVAVIILLI